MTLEELKEQVEVAKEFISDVNADIREWKAKYIEENAAFGVGDEVDAGKGAETIYHRYLINYEINYTTVHKKSGAMSYYRESNLMEHVNENS